MKTSQAHGRRLRGPATFVAVVAVAFGLLLWARLILVTGHPRTATAAPSPKAVDRQAGENQTPDATLGASTTRGTENTPGTSESGDSSASAAGDATPR